MQDATTTDTHEGYGAALAELERILAELEDHDIDVDVLAAKVERAAVLIEFCRSRIRDAQMKVERVVAQLDAGPAGADPLEPADEG